MDTTKTMDDVRQIAAKHGGKVLGDGMGGYEVIAPPHMRWKDAEVQCYVLPLNEYKPNERSKEMRRCIDMIEAGTERFPGE